MHGAKDKPIFAEVAGAANGLRPARISFRELEPRIAFDAAMGAALADMATDHHEAPPLAPADHTGQDAAYPLRDEAGDSGSGWTPHDALHDEDPAGPGHGFLRQSAALPIA